MNRIIKNDCLSRTNALKPYCFPEISVEYSSNDIEAGKESGFQRIGFIEIDKLFHDSPKVSKKKEKSVEKIKQKAREKEKSVEKIKQKARDVEKQAYIQGFAKGEMAGLESGENKFKAVLNNFRQAVLDLEKVRKEINPDAEKKAVNLALAIAKKVVCHEITTNQEVVLNVVKEAVTKVVDHGRIMIKISPSDLEFVKNSDHEFLNIFDNIKNIIFEEDETISDGGCVIETDFGDIEARIEKQFQVVDEAFKYEALMRGVIPEKRKTVSG